MKAHTQSLYQEIIDKVGVGLIGLDQDKKIFLWNPWVQERSGIQLDNARGKKIDQVFATPVSPRILNAIDTALTTGMPAVISNLFHNVCFPLTDQNHRQIQQSISVYAIHGADDNQCIVQILDVSSSSAREKALEKQVKERKKAEDAKSTFLANMSHEMRTPLNGVLGMLDLLQDELVTQKAKECSNIARTSAQSLIVLIDDILDLAKVEAGKLSIEKESFDLNEVLRQTILSISQQAFDKELELVIEDAQVPEVIVIGDPTRLKQILLNLLSNAIKFTETGYILVHVSYSIDSGELTCQVKDTGIGIPTPIVEHLFEPFKQADASISRRFGGTGLGLSISKHLCNIMGGEIRYLLSDEVQGSCFEFNLPLPCLKNKSTKCKVLNSCAWVLDENLIASRSLSATLESLGLVSTVPTDVRRFLSLPKNNLELGFLFITHSYLNQFGSQINAMCRQSQNSVQIIVLYSSIASIEANDKYSMLVKPLFRSSIRQLLEELAGTAEPIPVKLPSAENSVFKLKQSEILIVEDNLINQVVTRESLVKLGYQSGIASDGLDALNKLREKTGQPYGLILMDCQMPNMDGYGATQSIRRGEAGKVYKNIPIVALTANAIDSERRRCLDSGMNDFLSKPIQLGVLSEMLNKWLP